MIERLTAELVRKGVAGVKLTALTLWFNPKTCREIVADLEQRGAIRASPLTYDQRERFYLGWTIKGAEVKLSDRVKVGFVSVAMDDEVMAEWDLTEAA